MSWIRRCTWARVLLRAVLLFVSCELSLRAGAWYLERRTPVVPASAGAPILCIGDSNTFGVGAPAGASYPDQLRALLHAAGDPRDVVNLGFPGLDSDEIVARLERALKECEPSCVLFLGGYNDWAHAEALVGAGREADPPGAVAKLLARSLTMRVLFTATRVASGELSLQEFGGQSESPLPEPETVNDADWDAEYERARRHGFEPTARWIRFFFAAQDSDRIDRALADLRARPDLEQVKGALNFPLRDLEWEADLLAGRTPPRLAPGAEKTREGQRFAEYSEVWRALAAGRIEQVRAALPKMEFFGADPWAANFKSLYLAWCTLLSRDFSGAARELAEVAERADALSPNVGLEHALGAAAVATLLADGHARLATFSARYPVWDQVIAGSSPSVAFDWMEAARCIDAMRSGDAALLASTFQRERRRAGSKARTELMTWLLAHPDATCPQLRAELPLDPPRTSWIGSSGRVFRNIRREEFRQVTRAAQQRLASLSAKHGFPVVVLTYLNYEATMQNDTLRELAGERDWPLVDLPRRYPREELGADDKRKYFSADRGHPNAEGYRLMATAILETMRRHGLVHAAR